jgi:two-component system, chemotaxis family, CheB/CheR fusion protein
MPEGVSTVSIVPALDGRGRMRLTGLQILVIEDASDVLDVLTTLLRMEGADVEGAGNGYDALTVFRRRHFDVVVSDLGLPDMAGDVLIRTIIAAARRPVRVIVITGEGPPASIRALAAGAEVVFAKPCPWESVVTHLDALSPTRAA